MKKKTLLAGIVSGVVAYFLRRMRLKATEKKVDSTVAVWVRNLLFRWTTVQSFNTVRDMRENSIIPKWLRYKYTDICPDDRTTEHHYTGTDLVFIKGIPVWLCSSPNEFRAHCIYVPAWWWDRVKDVILPLHKIERIAYGHPSIYDAQCTTASNRSEWTYVQLVDGTLDEIPIHSEVRVRLDKHLATMNAAWDSGENVDYSRNILLHGPKGTGKSHIATALGVALRSDIYNFPNFDMRAPYLSAIRAIPQFSTVICDELQEIQQFNKRPLLAKSGEFSKRDALDTLSGMFSPPGVFGVYCTNDLSEIDDRIDRKGRFKEVIYVGPVDDAGIKRWLKTNHNYDVPDGIVLKEMFCMDIFDRMDTLDDAEAFVMENML